jgi:adenine-specific DNA methylase
MTRMIERWFPCQEVSENTDSGWGSGNSEKNLFTWFAARPLAQARAAVICSLLPWPDDPAEQSRLQALVRKSMTGRDAGHDEVVAEIAKHYPDGASMLDPYSGRAMIPLEAARLGVRAWGIDYSPVATLAGSLLADYPLRKWDDEPPLPFEGYQADGLDTWGSPRLRRDVEFVLSLIGDRYEKEMDEFYPKVDGKRPWGYVWAITLPCQSCGRTFPLTGNLVLRHPLHSKNDPGQSYRIVTDSRNGTFWAQVHDGPPTELPTLVTVPKTRGKAAICSFCEHPHVKDTHVRLMNDGLAGDELLVVADIDDAVGKLFREPAPAELDALASASKTLKDEPPFALGVPAIPDERVPPGNNHTVRPSMYGYRCYGSFCNDRQTLGFIRLARIIDSLAHSLLAAGISADYTAALIGYAAANVVRRIKYSTRGATLNPRKSSGSNRVYTGHIFENEASIAFSYDYFETGCGGGPATWRSVAADTVASLRNQLERPVGKSAAIRCGSASALPMRDCSLDAVVTDPPYDSMIDYSDASDLFFVWLKRALITSHPDFGITSHPLGVQEKGEEAIVKDSWKSVGDPRDEDHYDRCIVAGFGQARRKVKDYGIVTIVFGHGDPDVWHRLLTSIDRAGLILTGSWPARTESGGKAGSANIETTLTIACRPVPAGRQPGRVAEVDAEVEAEIRARMPLWDAAGLALTDQLMASAGPAMEVVGRYSQVQDKAGNAVALDRYLPLARKMVQEAADIRFDDLPLGTFDERSRFALFWAKLFGRSVTPGSEARWQRLAADLDEAATAGVTVKDGKGVRLAYALESATLPENIEPTTPVFDVALAMAGSGKSLAHAAQVLVAAGRVEDPYVWAAVRALSSSVPEADPDGEAWTYLVRNRQAVISSTRNLAAAKQREAMAADTASAQQTLFEGT